RAFRGLANLKQLTLRGNNLGFISSQLFNSLVSLERLTLSGNQIKEIYSDSFLPLSNIKFIDLSNNKLSLLSSSTFGNKENLENVILDNNSIEAVDRSFLQTWPSSSFLSILNNICIDMHFEEYFGSETLPMEQAENYFATCFENHDKLLEVMNVEVANDGDNENAQESEGDGEIASDDDNQNVQEIEGDVFKITLGTNPTDEVEFDDATNSQAAGNEEENDESPKADEGIDHQSNDDSPDQNVPIESSDSSNKNVDETDMTNNGFISNDEATQNESESIDVDFEAGETITSDTEGVPNDPTDPKNENESATDTNQGNTDVFSRIADIIFGNDENNENLQNGSDEAEGTGSGNLDNADVEQPAVDAAGDAIIVDEEQGENADDEQPAVEVAGGTVIADGEQSENPGHAVVLAEEEEQNEFGLDEFENPIGAEKGADIDTELIDTFASLFNNDNNDKNQQEGEAENVEDDQAMLDEVLDKIFSENNEQRTDGEEAVKNEAEGNVDEVAKEADTIVNNDGDVSSPYEQANARFYLSGQEIYSCVVYDAKSTLKYITGEHIEGFTDEHVEALFFRNSRFMHSIPGVIFERFPNLKTLSAENSEIKIADPELLETCGMLVNIDLSNNKIRRISKEAFSHCSQLEHLILTGNEIEHLDTEIFQTNPKLSVTIGHLRLVSSSTPSS
ncbi:CLUMA_CG018804, isoform A, partial [Clunio marinus]